MAVGVGLGLNFKTCAVQDAVAVLDEAAMDAGDVLGGADRGTGVLGEGAHQRGGEHVTGNAAKSIQVDVLDRRSGAVIGRSIKHER